MSIEPCPYCSSDNEAIRETYYDQNCHGCVTRMFAPSTTNTTVPAIASMDFEAGQS